MNEKLLKYAAVGGLYIIGGVIIRKLKIIHDEITYFEREKGISTKAVYERRLKEYWDKNR